MAQFDVQVEALTGITISNSGTNPTEGQLTQFLTDGVIDVTTRCISIDGKQMEDFIKVEESDTQGALGEGIGEVMTVIRESGTSSDWRSCRKVPITLQSRVTDVDSLHYSSKFSPSYLIDNKGKVLVYPAPSSGGANSYKVYYINNVPVNASYATLAYSHSDLGYFPKSKVYLVVIYASIKALENALSAKGIPTVAGDGTELTSVDDLDTDNTIDVHADQIEIDQWWSTAGHLIEGAEDLEMASVQLQKINAYIQAYGAQLQGNSTDYQWMQARHQILSKQYDTAFAMMRPPQPQVAGAR